MLAHPLWSSYHQSDLFGKLIFLFLLLASCITWSMILSHYFSYLSYRKKANQLYALLERKKEDPLNIELDPFHPFAILYRMIKAQAMQVLSKNYKENSRYLLSSQDIDSLRHYSTAEIEALVHRYGRYLVWLSTITTLSPFLGLLGTAWGILLTFSMLQQAVAPAQDSIMQGLSMALGTTVFGLCVAIPSLIGQNYLKHSLHKMSAQMEKFTESLLYAIALHYKYPST